MTCAGDTLFVKSWGAASEDLLGLCSIAGRRCLACSFRETWLRMCWAQASVEAQHAGQNKCVGTCLLASTALAPSQCSQHGIL